MTTTTGRRDGARLALASARSRRPLAGGATPPGPINRVIELLKAGTARLAGRGQHVRRRPLPGHRRPFRRRTRRAGPPLAPSALVPFPCRRGSRCSTRRRHRLDTPLPQRPVGLTLSPSRGAASGTSIENDPVRRPSLDIGRPGHPARPVRLSSPGKGRLVEGVRAGRR